MVRLLTDITAEDSLPHRALPYRADVDGLRAIAILIVLGFHAFPGLVPGGFVGVDVFFVLSGYLITSLLLTDLSERRFSLAAFYRRRARRLFPALALVLTACLLAGWFVLFSDEYVQLVEHLAAGTTFLSNALLWHQSGYFDRAGDTKPLLHLWSLAVEEQFYLGWPLLLALSWRRAWSVPRVLAWVGLVSFAVNLSLLVAGAANADFYAPWARLWELAAGGLLASQRHTCMARWKNAQSVAGLVLVAASAFLLDSERFFPGLWAVAPVLGTCLLLNAGTGAWLNRRVLSHPAAVGLGLVSFPLYLWHWPLLVFARLLLGDKLSVWISLAILGASLGLAWLTYQFVEKKIRHSTNRLALPALLMFGMALLYASTLVFLGDGYPLRRINHQSLIVDSAAADGSRRSDTSCARLLERADRNAEVCLTNSRAPHLMLAGDSHAMALYSAIYSKDIKTSALLVAWHSCPLYPNLQYTSAHEKDEQKYCPAMARAALDMAVSLPSVDTVLIVTYAYAMDDALSAYSFNGRPLSHREAFVLGSNYLVDQVLKAGKTPVFLVDVPHLRAEPDSCLARLSFLPDQRVCTDTFQENEISRRDYMGAIRELKIRNPGLVIYDPAPIFCPDGRCIYRVGRQALYSDTHHLSSFGAQFLLNHMEREGVLRF